MSPTPRIIVSLHDVTAAHLDRLRKAESLLRRLKVSEVQYLFVPEFHGRYRASEYPDFLEWCRRERSFAVSWWLHGYYHLDRIRNSEPASSLGFKDKLKRRFLTAGEGEFLALDAVSQRKRIAAGLDEFAHCLPGVKPNGFVPPAWLFKPEILLPVLKEFNLPFTEDHTRIFNVNKGATLDSPVITWATRTVAHKYGSLVVCPLRAILFRKAPVLRIAMHPHDFDHSLTVKNIEAVIRSLREGHEFTVPEKLEWGLDGSTGSPQVHPHTTNQ